MQCVQHFLWELCDDKQIEQRLEMNIQQLTYIVEIAKCKSISRASEYLFVSQPALSQQIRNLEKELGYRVFRRTSKGLELTEKGNIFYQKAQEMLEDWNRFKEEVISGTEHKKLKIGLGARVYSNRLFPKIAGYFEKHPELEVTFYTEAGLDAYAAIKDGSLDMALDRMPENEIGMEKCVCFAKELIREKQCILTAPDHPLARKKNASIMDCREYTMLTAFGGRPSPQKDIWRTEYHMEESHPLRQHRYGDEDGEKRKRNRDRTKVLCRILWGYGGATGSIQAGQSLFCLPEIKEKRAGDTGFSEIPDYSGFQCLSRLNPRPWTSCTWETMIKLSGSIRWTFFSSWTSSRLEMTVSTMFSCWFR